MGEAATAAGLAWSWQQQVRQCCGHSSSSRHSFLQHHRQRCPCTSGGTHHHAIAVSGHSRSAAGPDLRRHVARNGECQSLAQACSH